MHIMLMSVHGFCKNRRTEGRTFIVGVNEITFTHVRETLRHFEIKHAVVKSVHSVTEYTICSPVCF